MARNRFKFIPWNSGTLGIHNLNNQNLDEFALHSHFNNDANMQAHQHHKRQWTTVYANTPGQPLEDLGFGVYARLHIAGHGAVGSPNVTAPGAPPVPASAIAAGIEAKGLPKWYMGTIACDVCHSAFGNPSFAKTLARELWSLKYYHLKVLGYKGTMIPVYVPPNHASGIGGKYFHRTVNRVAKGGDVKSRKAQRRFWGGSSYSLPVSP